MPDGGFRVCPPDYLNDLNAMHEAELTLTVHQFDVYQHALNDTCYGKNGQQGWITRDLILATASQRAEAFLKTIGRWVDE